MITAKNIQWDLDLTETLGLLAGLFDDEAASVLKIPMDQYLCMTTEERRAHTEKLIKENPAELYEFLFLPEEVDVTEVGFSPDEITEWLSAMYGYLVKGYDLEDAFKERCKDCCYLIEDENGNWKCDDAGKEIHEIPLEKGCPVGE